MGIADRRRQQMVDTVTPQLEAGEQYQTSLPLAQTGPTPWFVLLTYLIFFFIRYLGVAVTDRRVFFVKRGVFTGRVKGIESVVGRGEVRVVEWKPGKVWGKMIIETSGTPLKLNVHRMHNADGDALVAALGGASGGAATS